MFVTRASRINGYRRLESSLDLGLESCAGGGRRDDDGAAPPREAVEPWRGLSAGARAVLGRTLHPVAETMGRAGCCDVQLQVYLIEAPQKPPPPLPERLPERSLEPEPEPEPEPGLPPPRLPATAQAGVDEDEEADEQSTYLHIGSPGQHDLVRFRGSAVLSSVFFPFFLFI